MRPPPAPLDDNHVRTLKNIALAARQSGTTATDKRRAQKITKGKKVPQLDEQANQLCPPLKVSSDIVVDGMAPGTKIGDYMPVDAYFDPLEVEEHKYRYG